MIVENIFYEHCNQIMFRVEAVSGTIAIPRKGEDININDEHFFVKSVEYLPRTKSVYVYIEEKAI